MLHPQRYAGGFVAMCLCLIMGATARADWPQFLGPDRNAVARVREGSGPAPWPAGGPKVLWEVPVNEGFGGPAIYRDSVLLLDREPGRRDILRRLRLADGKEVWRFAYDAPGKLSQSGGRSTPATDGRLVFTIGAQGHIHAVRFADGQVAWKAHLLKDWQSRRPGWGVATSPLLLGDVLVVSPWGRRAALVAYRKSDGKVLWTTPNPRGIALDYSSPVPMRLDRRLMVVASGKKSYTLGADARTGERLWTFSGYACSIHIPSPMVLDDGRVFLSGGYGAGSALFRVEKGPDGYRTRLLWRNKAVGTTIAQPVLFQDHIYLNRGFKKSVFGMGCLGLDGTLKWQTGRNPSFDMGNLILIGERLLIVDGARGDLVMVAPRPEGYRELARARVLTTNRAWAPLAYSEGKLVLRDRKKMVCLDLAAR